MPDLEYENINLKENPILGFSFSLKKHVRFPYTDIDTFQNTCENTNYIKVLKGDALWIRCF
jgi:hypothetical protein